MQRSVLNILLVEDSPTHARIIRDALRLRDRTVYLTLVTSLAEARLHLRENHPDLILCDLNLPDGKGTDLLTREDDSPNLPMVILTGQGDELVAVEVLKAGALDYLTKSPDALQDMPHIIERALREWRLLQDRRQAEEALRLSEERFRSVFQTVAAGMVVIDRRGNLLQVNQALCRLLGYPEQELLQLTVFDITHPEDRKETVRYYDDLFDNRCPMINMEKRYRRKNGETIWGHVSVACVSGAEGKPHYCVGLVQDITDRKRAEDKLLDINRELDAFVRTVSHDLRTPLTPIIGYAQFLKDHCRDLMDPTALNCLNSIEETGQRMLALLEDLLTLSQVGHLPTPQEPVPCDEVLREVLQMLGPRIVEKGIAVEMTLSARVQVPRTLLAQLFANLIGNAISYGGGPGATIEIGEKGGDGQTALYVRDHGEGIPESERERIFEVFYRGTIGKKTAGTGIGLATVRRIAHLFGGRAWVEETPGGGATFWVTFPSRSGDDKSSPCDTPP